jgi:hypothetical protein
MRLKFEPFIKEDRMSRYWAVLVLAVSLIPVTGLAAPEKGIPVRAYDMEAEINEHNQLPWIPIRRSAS